MAVTFSDEAGDSLATTQRAVVGGKRMAHGMNFKKFEAMEGKEKMEGRKKDKSVDRREMALKNLAKARASRGAKGGGYKAKAM